MKLYQCHAVLPLVGAARMHVVRTYVAVAATWEVARERVRHEEPSAVFVTTPVEMPSALMTGTTSMDERELADLRSACAWYEKQARNAAARSVHDSPDHTND